MIRLPKPPKTIGAPVPIVDYYNKFNEMINFQQNLISALEVQQKNNELKTSVTSQQSEFNAEAKSWFNG
tara:strand:- start:336 stop:542 length:207 start_codon:yes stop_codon:yes gene_type:complete